MKKFWKTVGAVLVGLLVLKVLGLVVLFSVIGSMGSSSNTVTEVPQGAILNIDMSTLVIAEQSKQDDPLAGLNGGNIDVKFVGILDAVRALEAAADDPKISCVYLRPDMASDISHLEEFRSAISAFRASGKPVYAYIQVPTNAGYYLASAADRIYMSSYHGGMVNLVGLSGQMVYYKDLLDRLGINMQLIRHGKYKSAGEPFIRSTASAENLEQQSVMINGIWAEMASAMVQKSGKSVEELNALIDNLQLKGADDFLSNGLVDELVTMNQMKEKLCSFVGVEKFKDVKSITLSDYATLAIKPDFRNKEAIAIIYADGEIVDGNGTNQVAGKYFAEVINKVAADESVKAVVLRVNSPGGSVVAASQIKDALDALAASKPIVASYGSYAASGGYWISACCDYIFSDATTLTGSIGVFGMIPDASKAAKDLAHLNIYTVSSNKHSDMYSLLHTLTDEETAYIQSDIEKIYTEFTTLVAGGRKMSVERVDELGQGRVWTGRDALKIGLVDEIGGLKEALDYTALKAGLGNYRVVSYPKPLTTMEMLMASLQPSNDDLLVKGAEALGLPASSLQGFKMLSKLNTPTVYARVPFVMELK